MKVRLKYYEYVKNRPKRTYSMRHRDQVYGKFKKYCPDTVEIFRATVGIPNYINTFNYSYYVKHNPLIVHKIGHPAMLSARRSTHTMWGKYNLWITDYPVWDLEVMNMLQSSFHYAFRKKSP